MLRKSLMATAISFAALSAQAQTVLLTENFDNYSTLVGSGWVLSNQSSTIGTTGGWYQGDQTIFTSQAGGPEAYLAANYNSTTAGGTIANYLFSPTFSTAVAGTISFWARADIAPDYFDTISYGLSSGASTGAPGALSFSTTLTGDWTQYTVDFASAGAGSVGRFVIEYTGSFETSNYIGIDTLTVTAVPEPSTWLLMGFGLAGVATVRGRRSAAKSVAA